MNWYSYFLGLVTTILILIGLILLVINFGIIIDLREQYKISRNIWKTSRKDALRSSVYLSFKRESDRKDVKYLLFADAIWVICTLLLIWGLI